MPASAEARRASSRVVEARDLSALLDALKSSGHRILGPVVRDGAIVLDEIASADDLPRGVGQTQSPGRYRLRPRGDGALFGYAAGPQAWKRFLFPPSRRVFSAAREKRTFRVERDAGNDRPDAFFGVRPCDVAAIRRQDRALAGGAYADPDYAARRARALVVAVTCTEPEETCFCASTGTGPGLGEGYDLALTELRAEGRHELLAEPGSSRGEALLAGVPSRPATAADLATARASLAAAAGRMGRRLDVEAARAALPAAAESARWEEIASRCLSCANCTMVCPTCFCTTVDDASDLANAEAWRTRRWDSCHTLDFSYIHGGSIRRSPAARYRQWMTHKLSTWFDQFGEAGCVGCGRCITWCPAGIDLTEEARILAEAGDSRPAPAA